MRKRLAFALCYCAFLGFSQPAFANSCVVSQLQKLLQKVPTPVGSKDSLEKLVRPINSVWSTAGFDGRRSTAIAARMNQFVRSLGPRRADTYRSMWLTPDEIVDISKNGISPSGGYGDKIYFANEPSESIRYGMQGADWNKENGVLVLFAADARRAGAVRRPLPDNPDQLMIYPTAQDHVPADALTSAWVYDPSLGENMPFRSINLRSLRRE